nr:cobalamin B12-binding domain-containing protein [Bacillus sp. REN3]
MFLCVEKEQHYLGLKMASQLFSEAGWRTRFHGPNLPLDYVRKAAEEWQPDVICISFSIIYHAEYLVTYISELEALPLRPTVIVGGRLVGKYNFDRYRSERTILTDNLKDVQKWLSSQSNGVKSSV